ncbi:MAG: amidohydrolase family protein [Nitrososphaerales archaeon]
MDLVVRNARLMDLEGLWEISVESGTVKHVSRSLPKSSGEEIDGEGGLLLPTFIEPHVHLDKILLGEELKEATSIPEARELVKEAKKKFTVDNVRARMERAIPWAVQNGVTEVRTHIDVDSIAKLASVEATLKVRKKYEKVIDVQIVAFPQEGLIRDSQALELVRKALELGCDVVGGMPEGESSIEDARRHIDLMIELAQEKGLAIDVHCDVLPFGKNIEYYAAQSLKSGLGERSTADHLIALSYYDDSYASRIIDLIKKASMNVVTNPCTMMTSGATDRTPTGRGITRVKELLRAGVNVAFGSDNIVDPYNPLGDFNPLSNGFLLAYGAQLSLLSDLESIVKMPTLNSSKILGLRDYGIRAGCKADFNIFREKSVRELLRNHGRPRYVFKNGNKISENQTEAHSLLK